MSLKHFLSLPSWSVEYHGVAHDDARRSDDGVWYYRDIITNEIRCFANQQSVVPLHENPIGPSKKT